MNNRVYRGDGVELNPQTGQPMNSQDSDWLEELKKTAITKFHNDHNDGDVAIYELVRGIQAHIEADRHHYIALARLDECNLRYKFLLDTTKPKDFQKGFKAAFKQIDTVLDNRIAQIEKSMESKE